MLIAGRIAWASARSVIGDAVGVGRKLALVGLFEISARICDDLRGAPGVTKNMLAPKSMPASGAAA